MVNQLFLSGILISRPNLLCQIHFNFNIVNVVLISIITTLLIVLPIAIKINFSSIEYPNFQKVYKYYTGLSINYNLIPFALIVHLIYELFFDKILEGVFFFVIFKDYFDTYGLTLGLILTNLCYTIFQTLSLYYEEKV